MGANSNPRSTVRVGTRGSRLALTQTELTLNILRAAHPGIEFLPVTVTTSGDADQRAPLAGMGLGVFVKEIEYRLEKGEIDMAVHSLKDMPTALPGGMCIGAVLERADPRDVFVSHLGTTLGDFPEGKRIGTSSPRRKAHSSPAAGPTWRSFPSVATWTRASAKLPEKNATVPSPPPPA